MHLLPLLAPLVLVAAIVWRASRPARIDVARVNECLVVTFHGWDVVWAFRRRVEVPLAAVVSILPEDRSDVPRRGMRIGGTGIPGVIAAGNFGWGDSRQLWNVRRGRRLLHIEVDPPSPYRHLVLEVPDPDGAAERLLRG